MYDNVCKFLAETFSRDFATWLLGEPIPLTQLSPTELSLEPIRADALILLESDEIVLHLEFQAEPDVNMPFRMLDYRLRVYRRFPQKQMRQVVIYLRPTSSDLVQQTAFAIPGTHHEFEVIRLWEQPTALFLQSPGLIPFAALSNAPDRVNTLRQAATEIQSVPEPRLQNNLAASTAILAGLLLDKQIIQQILRSEAMKESVIYQEIKAEGKAEGRLEGKLEGKLEGELNLILRLLNLQIGLISPDLLNQIQQLSLTQIEELGEALLSFSQPQDLQNWLSHNLEPSTTTSKSN